MDKINSPIKERLLKYIEIKDIKKESFLSNTGIAASNFKGAGLKSELGGEKIAKILSVYTDINSDWLLTGNGEMLNPTQHKPHEEARLIENPNVMLVPMVSQYAYAGYLGSYGDIEYMENLPQIPFFVSHDAKGNYICFEVRGDSMYDGTDDSIIEGDRLLCREIPPYLWTNSKLHIKKWDFVILHKTEGVLIKRIEKHEVDKQEITIHSLNAEYEDKILSLTDVVQIFNVIEVSRPRKR